MIYLFIIYGLLVISVGLWYRKHSSNDEFLMGNRKASAILVAAALFTLVGGGELVTLTALAYTYGFAALSLFIGYALGFCFLGIIAKRVRQKSNDNLYLSLPDYAHANFGRLAGHLVFLISFGAFFAMLLIQFTAGGQLLSSLTNLSYTNSILLTALICTTYLFIGGFRTVLATDLIQGIARLLLMPLLVFVAAKGVSQPLVIHSETLPYSLWISLIVTGFFSSASSADVWQRIYAAKSNKAATRGLIFGALLLILFGLSLVGLGMLAHNSHAIKSADTAFTEALTTMLPYWAVILAVVLVISVIMSTADTEMFLLSGMTLREIIRFKGTYDFSEISKKQSIKSTRLIMILITSSAIILSFYFRELITIYTWLLAALLIIAPMILFSLFVGDKPIAARASLISNLIIFLVLVYLNILTPDNAYFIVLPGALIYIVIYFFSNKYKHVNTISDNKKGG